MVKLGIITNAHINLRYKQLELSVDDIKHIFDKMSPIYNIQHLDMSYTPHTEQRDHDFKESRSPNNMH